MGRDEFLSRVRTAAHAGRAYRVTPVGTLAAAPPVGYVGAGDDPIATFAAELTAVGGNAYVADDFAAAAELVQRLLQARPIQSALCADHPVLKQMQLAALLATLGIAVLEPSMLAAKPLDERRALILAADIGITSADFAIAETGSLVLLASPVQERLLSLAPPVHIAIIEAKQIVPDLFDVFADLERRGVYYLASNATIITGPSKTGDIELQLTTGVHGPGEIHVVVIR